MDNIATQLTQLQTIKQNIATAIEGKGGTVGTGFASYATAITNLPDSSGGGGSAVFRVSENPSVKFGASSFQTVPSNIIVDTLTTSLFYQCYNLTSIAIPNGVTRIPADCFMGCTSLTTVTGEQDVSVIESFAFSGCGALLFMPNCPNVKYIQDSAFRDCYSLTGDASFPSSVVWVGNDAFHSCTSLESVTFNDCSCNIGDSAFAGCTSIESVDFNDSSCNIGAYAFTGSPALESVTFGNNIQLIQSEAFSYCESLTSIGTLPAKYHLFGDDLTTLTGQFRDSVNIEAINIPGVIELIPQDCFCGCNNATTITIGEGITEIGQGAFYSCKAVEELTLPSTLTYIGPDAFVALESLTQLIVLAETPPAFEEGTYPFDEAEYPIYVPDRSYTDYLYDWGQYLSDSTRIHRMRDLPSS